jgi:hypothetical protein
MFAVSGLTVGLLVSPAAAQTAAEYEILKVVDGASAPEPGTEFTVTVECTGENPLTVEVVFDETGEPLTDNSIDTGSFTGSCTFTETATGGATAVSYACDPTEEVECTGGGADPITFTWDGSDAFGSVTVTNTFDPPPPEPVEVVPAFTG